MRFVLCLAAFQQLVPCDEWRRVRNDELVREQARTVLVSRWLMICEERASGRVAGD